MDDPRPLVMHVIHHLVIGGMENGLVNLINHLPSDEFRHAVVCVEDYSAFRSRIRRPDVGVFALHRSRIGTMAMRRELVRLFRGERPRIVHTRNQSGLDALPAAWLARVPRRVHSEHGWDVNNLDGQQWRPRWLRRLHSPFVHRYVAVTQDLARFLGERIGIDRRRIQTIPNGVDTDRFAPGPIALDLGLPPDFLRPECLRIGTVGRLQPVKDQGTLIDAAAWALEREPALAQRLRLILVGDGPLRDGLRQRCEQRGLAALTYFTGATDRVPDCLRAFDVFVLPSLNEGMSNTLLEAMACGVPALTTPVGGNVELVVDGQCGGLFPVGDVRALGERLLAYAHDARLRRSHGAAARQRIETGYSLRVMVDSYRRLYQSLSAQSRV